jgi:exodeoxyribonuclease X
MCKSPTLIRVIDLEATGFSPPEHEPIEIGWCDLTADLDLVGEPTNWRVLRESPAFRLVKPGRAIPPESSAVHHLIWDDVKDAPSWSTVLPPVLAGADVFAAHSAKMERQWLTTEVSRGRPWVCTYKAALRIWPDAPGHSVQTLRYWRKPDGLDRRMAMPAHRAGPDAYATAFLLRDMLDYAPISDLIAWADKPALQTTCWIGKQRGMKWREVDTGFLEWCSDKDFDEDVLFTVRTELERRDEERRQYEETYYG